MGEKGEAVTPRGDETQVRSADTDALIEAACKAMDKGDYLRACHHYSDALARERKARGKADENFKGIAAEMLRQIGDLQQRAERAEARAKHLEAQVEPQEERG